MGRPKIRFSEEQDKVIRDLFGSLLTTHEIVNRYEQRFFSRVSYTALRIRYLEIQNATTSSSSINLYKKIFVKSYL